MDPAVPEAFAQLGTVALFLDGLRGEAPASDTAERHDDAESHDSDAPDAASDVGARFGGFLFFLHHACRHATGAPLLVALPEGAIPRLVAAGSTEGAEDASPPQAAPSAAGSPAESGSTGAAPPAGRGLPAASGYLRLPRNRFWVRPGGDGSPAEALDGISWVARQVGRGDEGGTLVSLLAVSGILPGRPGFSVLPLPPLALQDLVGWRDREAREPGAGVDFSSTLPGGELGGLHSVETPAELVKLTARGLALVPRAGQPPEGGDDPSGEDPSGDDPSFDTLFSRTGVVIRAP